MELFKDKKLWMPDMVLDGFERGGDKTFAIYQRADGSREEYSYNDIYAEGQALLEKLQASGLRKGDRLAVVSAMRPWWYSVLYAALHGGYRMVCIDPGIPMPRIQDMIEETDSRAVLTTHPSFRLPSRLDGRIPVWSVSPGFPSLNGCEKVDILLESAAEMPEDCFFILFSSGTTGENRKCVLLPHTTVTTGIEYGMSTDAGIFRRTSAYTPRKRDLMLFPPYHIAGLLCAVYDVYCNTQIIMLERLTPNALGSSMQELKPDNICTVPSMLTLLMKKIMAGLAGKKIALFFVTLLMNISGFFRRVFGWNIGRRLLSFLNRKAFGGNMDGLMIGGSPCDAETMRFFLNMGIDVSLAYGLTELGAPLAVTGRGYYPGTTGRVLRHTPAMDIRVVNLDEKGRGEVEILSPYRMIKYLRDSDNIGSFTEDGYFRSGDLGYFDKNDCLVICGRAKEAIVLRNGEKLLPEEIEKHYENIEAVGELAVFRVPGDGGCDSFAIAAVRMRSKGVTDEIVRIHILDRASTLPAMYQPKEVYMLPELPLSSSHKVQRFRLTEMALSNRDTPLTEACLKAVEEDETVAALRSLLETVAGPHWKTAELTEGLFLNLDSLQTIELFVAILEKFGMELFQLATAPETCGALLDAVKHFDEEDKNDKPELDLSQFPQPVTNAERAFYSGVEKLVKTLWNVHGVNTENIPAEGNFLICSNHVTVLDPGWISCCMPRAIRDNTAIVGKSDLVDDKLLKNFVRSHNLIPVDRTGNSLATLDRCRELLDEGWNVLIFPEGTNYENTKGMLTLKEGPARLAVGSGKSVLPVRIKGLSPVDQERKAFLPPMGDRIEVVFGTPISPEGLEPAELNEKLRAAIEAL